MQALVLGGCGFVGSHLVELLLEEGWQVRCVSRRPPGVLPEPLLIHPRLELIGLDLSDPVGLLKALEGVDVAFHLASSSLPQTAERDPTADVHQHLLPALHLLTAASDVGLPRLVVVSSGGTVYGPPRQVPIPEEHPTEPSCIYGIHKLTLEKYCALFRQQHGLDVVVLRVANPYGERQRTQAGQGVVAVWLQRALRGEPIQIWGDGSVIRDFLHVHDVARALRAAANYQGADWIFNIGSGQGLSLNHLLQQVEVAVGRPVERIQHAARGFDVPANVLAIDRARRELAWEPVITIPEGLARFAAALRTADG